ncbi:MAG: hypothetical protein OEY14_01040 [Myxococcales bacterium]|nr:hypothetical protein [Myxococcales bacterium]
MGNRRVEPLGGEPRRGEPLATSPTAAWILAAAWILTAGWIPAAPWILGGACLGGCGGDLGSAAAEEPSSASGAGPRAEPPEASPASGSQAAAPEPEPPPEAILELGRGARGFTAIVRVRATSRLEERLYLEQAHEGGWRPLETTLWLGAAPAEAPPGCQEFVRGAALHPREWNGRLGRGQGECAECARAPSGRYRFVIRSCEGGQVEGEPFELLPDSSARIERPGAGRPWLGTLRERAAPGLLAGADLEAELPLLASLELDDEALLGSVPIGDEEDLATAGLELQLERGAPAELALDPDLGPAGARVQA